MAKNDKVFDNNILMQFLRNKFINKQNFKNIQLLSIPIKITKFHLRP